VRGCLNVGVCAGVYVYVYMCVCVCVCMWVHAGVLVCVREYMGACRCRAACICRLQKYFCVEYHNSSCGTRTPNPITRRFPAASDLHLSHTQMSNVAYENTISLLKKEWIGTNMYRFLSVARSGTQIHAYAHTHQSCIHTHARTRVMSHIWMSHAICMEASCHTYKRVMSRI